MLLLFVGGVMNLYWIIGLTVYVWLEKVSGLGLRLSRATGALLCVAGIWVIGAALGGAN